MAARPFDRLRTGIVEYADRLAEHIAGVDFARFEADRLVYDAVERCAAIITEAVIRLGPERLSEVAPDVPFHAVRSLGNQLRHAYKRIDPVLIWKTVTEDVPALRAACVAALSRS